MGTSQKNVIKAKASEPCCRTCNEERNINFLHSLEKRIENYPSFANMLLEIAGINIKIDKFLPKYICERCSNNLKNAYTFVKQAQRLNKQFVAKLQEVPNEQIQLKELQIKAERTTDENNLESFGYGTLSSLETYNEFNIKQEEFICLKQQDETSSLIYNSIYIAEKKLVSNNSKNDLSSTNDMESSDSKVSDNQTKCSSRKLLSNKKPISNGRICCNICGKIFAYKSSLHRHEQTHFEPNLECKFCDRKFFRKYELKIHLNIHEKSNNN